MFILVNEYTTTKDEINILEAHKKYIDLQYVLKGTELVKFESLNKQKVYKEYNSDDDYILYKSQNKTQKVRKVVIKILIN